jgi:hypothetical protein
MATRTGQLISGQEVQGLELNVNHLRAVPVGDEVLVIAKPVVKGSRIQVHHRLLCPRSQLCMILFYIKRISKQGEDRVFIWLCLRLRCISKGHSLGSEVPDD